MMDSNGRMPNTASVIELSYLGVPEVAGEIFS